VFELAAYQHSFLRFTGGDVVITAMASDAAMAVVTKPGAQLSTVAHEMALFAKRVGENFDLAPRKVVRS
jgi:predicted regulator of Ras-like GTPase activity (Roadblock/LC7/MglB family)